MNAMTDDLHIDDCWNRIGVWSRVGASCPRLIDAVHCHHCEVYSAAGRVLLDRPLSPEARRQWDTCYDQPNVQQLRKGTSCTVFRIGAEWLALPTLAIKSVAAPVPVRRIPHRRNPVLRGMANLTSELALVVSLAALLGITDEPAPALPVEPLRAQPISRLLWVRGETGSFAFESDEVSGTHRYEEIRLAPVPSTLEKAVPRYVRGTLEVAGRRVGVLDFELLAYAVGQALK